LPITSEPAQISKDSSTTNRLAVSVIIPVLDEEDVIGQCLSCIARQCFPPDQFEVIVVDNGSVDLSLNIARSFNGLLKLTTLRKTNSYISALRNLGAASAKGEFLAFLDADCLAPPDWLIRAVEILRSGDGGIAGAFYTVPKDSSWVANAWYKELPELKRGEVSYVPAGTLFVNRKVFLKLGGFDSTIQTCEDFEFCQRVANAGYRVLAFPELSTVHLRTPQTLLAFYRKQRWHGNSARTVLLKNKSESVKTMAEIACTMLWMLAALLAVPIGFASRSWAFPAITAALPVLISFALAARTAAQDGKWTELGPLAATYFVYGIARAFSLLGWKAKRVVLPVSSSSQSYCAEDLYALKTRDEASGSGLK
jgi:glycosyltransferase involved in cell wall biosynthesis